MRGSREAPPAYRSLCMGWIRARRRPIISPATAAGRERPRQPPPGGPPVSSEGLPRSVRRVRLKPRPETPSLKAVLKGSRPVGAPPGIPGTRGAGGHSATPSGGLTDGGRNPGKQPPSPSIAARGSTAAPRHPEIERKEHTKSGLFGPGGVGGAAQGAPRSTGFLWRFRRGAWSRPAEGVEVASAEVVEIPALAGE